MMVLALAGCGKSEKNGSAKSMGNQTKAQTGEAPKSGQGVPTESVTACDGKSEGDSCEVTMPAKDENSSEQTMSGTCKKSQSDDKLACMPSGGQGGPGGPNGQKPADAPVQE